MPQISLYIDSDTLTKIERAAKLENKSISKWVSSKIKSSLENKWPEDWFNLFGSLEDESFVEQKELSFDKDFRRNTL